MGTGFVKTDDAQGVSIPGHSGFGNAHAIDQYPPGEAACALAVFEESVVNFANNVYGVATWLQLNPPADTDLRSTGQQTVVLSHHSSPYNFTDLVIGQVSEARHEGSGNVATLLGSRSAACVTGLGSTGVVCGASGCSEFSSASTSDVGVGVRSYVSVNGPAQLNAVVAAVAAVEITNADAWVTDVIGMVIYRPIVSGHVMQAIGLLVEDQSGAAPLHTNVLSLGAGSRNDFEGKIIAQGDVGVEEPTHGLVLADDQEPTHYWRMTLTAPLGIPTPVWTDLGTSPP